MSERSYALLAGLLIVVGAYVLWTRASTDDTFDSVPPLDVPMPGPLDVSQLGQPREDLSAEELTAFDAGKALFMQKPPTMGPLYNAEACVACHFSPTIGGNGPLERAAFVGADPTSGDVLPFPAHALPGWTVPARPPGVSHRIPPPLYGMGLVERIPDETIRAACGAGHFDPAKNLGTLPKNTVARFGAKPFVGTLPDFIDSALTSEMSVTTAIEPASDDDAFPDPEVDRKFVETIAAFVRGLRPPGRNGNDAQGEAAFHSFGCATCHVPDMLPAKDVFSDFCVHRMGAALADGIIDHDAKGDEFRTIPLQGLRFRSLYMHDGRATSLDDAIKAHGGEGNRAARRYVYAPLAERQALLRFLHTL